MPPEADGKLEKSVFLVSPRDEFNLFIATWIRERVAAWTSTNGNGAALEVETKLGAIVDPMSGLRTATNYPLETVSPGGGHFRSVITEDSYLQFRRLLIARTTESNTPGYPFAKIARTESHTVDIVRQVFLDGMPQNIRFTYDMDFNIVAIIQKQHLGHLEVTLPRHPYDYRVSVNAEVPYEAHQVPVTNEEPILSEREKIRDSFRHQIFTFDLTEVRTTDASGAQVKTFELEIEIDPSAVSAAVSSNDPSSILNIIQILRNNLHLLVKNSFSRDLDVAGPAV